MENQRFGGIFSWQKNGIFGVPKNSFDFDPQVAALSFWLAYLVRTSRPEAQTCRGRVLLGPNGALISLISHMIRVGSPYNPVDMCS